MGSSYKMSKQFWKSNNGYQIYGAVDCISYVRFLKELSNKNL